MTGKPFNIASYALLAMMVVQICNLAPGYFLHTRGDAQLYSNSVDQAREPLSRTLGLLPTLFLNPDVIDLFALRFEDFRLEGYTTAPKLRAPIGD